MQPTNDINYLRNAALAELASLTSMEFGKLSELYRPKAPAEGGAKGRSGPYFKLQRWENGKNLSTYIHPEHVERVRADLESGRRFRHLTGQLATMAIEQSRASRMEDSSRAADGKKNSNSKSSRKGMEKRKSSSPSPGRASPRKG